MSVSECSWLPELKSVLINASDYSSGKGQSAAAPHTNTQTHTKSRFLGTQIDTEALQKSDEGEDIKGRNELLAQNTY